MPIDPTGVDGPTRWEVEQRYWRPTTRGLYVPSDVTDEKVEQRILEQSMAMPSLGAVTGWASCRLHGANFCDGLGRDGRTRLPVPINVGQRGALNRTSDVRPVFRHLDDVDRAVKHGMATVSVERATYDAVLLAPDAVEAVVAIDVMCAAELVSLRMLRTYADAQRFRRKKFETALSHASEHSRSPNEVRLRRLLADELGLDGLIPNCSIHDLSGRLLGIADLLHVPSGTAMEFHGADHRGAVRQTTDIRKEEALRKVKIEVTSATGMELHEPAVITDRVRAALGRAWYQPVADRLWVPRPPADDLHQRIQERRALDEMHAAYDAQPLPDIRDLRGY